MPDRRETILAAMFTAIQATVADSGETLTFERNRPDAADPKSFPLVLMYDGDEDAPDPQLRPINRQAVTKLVMQPEVWGYVEAKASEVGTKLNHLRARVIKAIFTNAAFIAAVGNEVVTIGPTKTGLGKSKQAMSGFGLTLSITYDFNPREP